MHEICFWWGGYVLIDYKAQNGAVKIDSDRQNWRRRTFAGKPTINGFRR